MARRKFAPKSRHILPSHSYGAAGSGVATDQRSGIAATENNLDQEFKIICVNLRNLWINSWMAGHARFQKLVEEAKKNITEISPQDAGAAKRPDLT